MRYSTSLIPALAIAGVACASLRSGSSVEREPALSGTAVIHTGVNRSTGSVALDRMTKRSPELNGVVQHDGTGRGVSVYVFDGGIARDHPELDGRVRIGFDAFPSNPRVCNPHGTAVAGAIAGKTLGVAPGAEIVDVKVINCGRGRGSVEAIVAAARWVVDDHRRHPQRPAIANWSFVVDTTRVVPEIGAAIALLRDAGIPVIASAGNFEIDACRVSPANSGGAVIVGATALERRTGGTGWHDIRASETAWGTCIDIYAPGESVLLPGLENGKPITGLWNGTSVATGYVSGAAALLLERMPSLLPDAVAAMLQAHATRDVVDERVPSQSSTTPHATRLVYVGPTTSP